jgi:hypothetical protein
MSSKVFGLAVHQRSLARYRPRHIDLCVGLGQSFGDRQSLTQVANEFETQASLEAHSSKWQMSASAFVRSRVQSDDTTWATAGRRTLRVLDRVSETPSENALDE